MDIFLFFPDTDIDDTACFVIVFNRITDNVINDPVKLLRIGDQTDIIRNIIQIGQYEVPALQLRPMIR